MVIDTPRTRLRCWHESDREPFAAMLAHPDVMLDQGGPIGRNASDAKLDRYVAAFDRYGLCRWALERRDGMFLGYAGVMPRDESHVLGPHFDVGWRLARYAWGHGYATEAAHAALHDAFSRVGMAEILAYTARDNLRSQAVIDRLRMQRDPSRDFTADYNGMPAWRGLVWIARSAAGVSR